MSNDRKKHVWAVAEFLKNFASQKNMSKEEIQDLFVLGLLHDIGYEFCNQKNTYKHNIIGGNLLKEQGYKFWKEIYFHGVANSSYQSYYLNLLNWADMHIDSSGNIVSYEERLKDIYARHNKSAIALESMKLIEELKQKGFK